MSSAPFRHRQLAWLVAAALAGPGVAVAVPAGRVEFAIGGVSVTSADGKTQTAARGVEVQSGDRIVTTDGRAQIRFTDGAYVSLQPNTDFAIREYRYDGKTDGTERGIFGVLRGALRTVTGAIGRVNRSAYQVQTPTATIGIRGTGGLIQVLANGTTLVVSTSGIWSLTNPSGTLNLPAGTAGETTPDPQQPPKETTQGPVVPAPPTPLQFALLPPPQGPQGLPPIAPTAFVAGDKVTSDGLPASLVTPLGCTTGCELAYATLTGSTGFIGTVQSVAAPSSGVVLDSGLAMVGFTTSAGQPAAVGMQIETGTADNVVSWGRWTSATLAGTPWPLFNTLAYVTGLPSPIADLTSSTATYTYSLIGGTNPTDGTNVGTILGGQLIGFFGANPKVGISNFMYSIRGNTYTINTPIGGELVVPPGGPFAPFAGSVAVPIAGSDCTLGCTAAVNGHFMGNGATHAGFAYSVSGIGSPATVGAAAFKR